MSYKKSGIYVIKNLYDGKRYIGQSVNIGQRKSVHFKYLRENIHQNNHLQSSYNVYGENNFTFETMELCNKELLNEREIYYIELYNTTDKTQGYNKTYGGDSYELSIEAQEQRRDFWNKKTGKPIYQIDFYGNICCEWRSARMASRELNINQSCIHACLSQKRKSYKNFLWVYQDELSNFELSDHINLYGQKNGVKQLDMVTGNTIREYKSAKEASEENNFDHSSIVKCCNGKYRSHKGYKWQYLSVINKNIVNKNWSIPKKVVQLDLNGAYIAEFDNSFQASKVLDIGINGIRQCVKGLQVYTKGFKFMFSEDYFKQ